MERKYLIRKTIIFIFVSLLYIPLANAQLDNIGKFLSANLDNSEKILEAYISPYASALGGNLSAGWYNTAKPHKLGGFDITINASTAFILI